MRRIFLHTYLREDGLRIPYRVSAEPEKLSPYHPDDRVEEGVFLTDEELAKKLSDASREGFKAARERNEWDELAWDEFEDWRRA